ncbi:MAG: 2-oxoglutarate dehydrogenase E1 subunit family protein, partial [Pyrinomonadaceae bacterium]
MTITTDLSQFIKDAFGSNAEYVEALLKRYQSDPNLVDESWQQYFGDLLNGTSQTRPVENVPSKIDGSAHNIAIEAATPAIARTSDSAKTTNKLPTTPSPDPSGKPITGPAKKIVENMEQSLTVPTATSFRNVPVKVLEENRNPHQWRRVRYSYMDCRRQARKQGLVIRGTQKIWDSSLAA